MARRAQDFYRAKRQKRHGLLIILCILLLLFLGVLIVLFFSTQKYAVITSDGVTVELPFLTGEKKVYDDTGHVVADLETTDVTVNFVEADYSDVKATAGTNLGSIRAIFVPYEDVNAESIYAYADRLSSGNALLLEVKKKDGYLAWYSSSAIAYSYGLNMVAVDAKEELTAVLKDLKDDGIYLAAQISCCMDELLGARSTGVCLMNASGMHYYDEYGYWLDPYSTTVRNYTVQLVRELWDMGFDEVVLQNLAHPTVPEVENPDGTFATQIYYTREMSTTPTPIGAVCGFAVYVTDQLADREEGKFLSAYLNSSSALVKADTANGQDSTLFLKVFDRVYYETDKYAYTYNVQDITPFCTKGSIKSRFVPVVINYLPDNTSWVLVDKSES